MRNRFGTRLRLALALLPLALAGCAVNVQVCPPCQADPANPQVRVVGGKIQVDQEVIRFGKDQTNVRVTWRLPADGKYSFPENGIDFDKSADGEVQCHRGEKPTEFVCLNRHTRRGYYKYDVHVNGEDGKPLPPLDPFMMND